VLEKFGILIDGRYIVSDLIHSLETADGESVSLLFADVDDFKRFNSQYGYKAGDEVLRHVFRVTRRIVGNHGEVYRRGGEEIIAILPYVDLKRAIDLGERIRERVCSTSVHYENEELHATLGIGRLAASPPHDPDGPGLETYAEHALGQAKTSGKNRLVLA
jgi:diguanylate cyclase (GGDEF)-like protein